ncbi:MAG TPA: DmsC/YnfH family molybdoenzyme membrane anchor subunit [Acidobacteriaceae bacterium]|jgi:DMSO reductase iron-sulfur subunit
METGSIDLVRMTLLAGGAAPQLVETLIPTRPLEADEQYRFHFDMTKCIGCRSCEIACNEQNGNPAGITWRRVGELEGGVYPDTQRTYLSMGCNHCLDADCLKGCPVDAYTKDSATGIVLHSADACIGCQYCVWNCPYSVPQFNAERGVVGKCDMCRGRLNEGLEPACVNACPENAIQIEIVNKIAWRENYAEADSPGMPPAGQTVSTTRITLPGNSSSWLQRVDTGTVPLEHAHPSLVAMTTAMQATFGTLTVLVLASALDTVSITLLVLLTAVALTISVFHLGRPAYAWRALKMWRRSWLSREVLCFGLFFLAIGLCAAASWAAQLGFPTARLMVYATAWTGVFFGLCGTLASAYIYLVRARPAWNMVHTPLDFLLSAGLLGCVMTVAMRAPAAALSTWGNRFGLHLRPMPAVQVALPLLVISLCWVLNQAVRTMRMRASLNFEMRASFNLLRGKDLWWVGALALIAVAMTPLFAVAPMPLLATGTAVAAVMLQRYLFFVSVVPLSMGLTFLGNKAGLGRAA